MKSAILLSPYFPPSNLAGVQRVRLMASHLHRYGWKPIVLAVRAECYEGDNDAALVDLLPQHLRVERVNAWPARICRPLGFGDVSIRAQWALRRRVGEVVRRERADLIFCTVLPGYASLVGGWAKRKFSMPFVLDYQDPWVSDLEPRQPRLSKAGMSYWLATKLEPRAVAAADALTAVSDRTFDTLRARNLIKPSLPVEIIPIGVDSEDHVVAARDGKSLVPNSDLRSPNSEFHLAYIGTVIEGMLPSVRTLFCSVRAVQEMHPARRLRIHFIGTSAQSNGQDTLGLEHLASNHGVRDAFRLEPRRIRYLDALRTMQDADALLLLGSQDAHYTASKLFPYWVANKPVLGLFHAASTVNELAHEVGGVRVITYDGNRPPETCVAAMTSVLSKLVTNGKSGLPPRNDSAFEPYTARGVACRFARLFDRLAVNRST